MTEKKPASVSLALDWDIPLRLTPTLAKREGHFFGRRKEVDLLTNEILRKRCGAILISGYRGVGKTSLVYKAISQAHSQDSTLIAVLLNAAQLEAEAESKGPVQGGSSKIQIDPRHVIVNLIRRLYSTMHEVDSKNERLINLYKRAVAASVKISENSGEKKREIEDKLQERKLDMKVENLHAELLIFAISWVVGAAVFFFTKDRFPAILQLLGAGAFLGPLPILLSISYQRYFRRQETVERFNNAETLYEFDGSIGNLEFEFELLHREWAGKYKLVYVIDELDKLEIERVEEVLKFFKNLFTASDAQFIFLGNDVMYRRGLHAMQPNDMVKSGFRAKEYTYFTSRYFLSRPQSEDLDQYLDGILQPTVAGQDLSDLKRILCFEARNDFFDLREKIRDRISGFGDDSRPMIRLSDLTEDDLVKSRLHSAISMIYSQKYASEKHSEWESNELMLRALFDDAERMRMQTSGAPHNDPTEVDVPSMAIRDFHMLLQRHGYLNLSNENEKQVGSRRFMVRAYVVVGGTPTGISGQLEARTEYEHEFINTFDDLVDNVLAVNNLFRFATGKKELPDPGKPQMRLEFAFLKEQLGQDLVGLFDRLFPIYSKLDGLGPVPPFKRDQVAALTKEVEAALKGHSNLLPHFFTESLKHQENLGVQTVNLSQNGNLFSGSATSIRDIIRPTNPVVVFKPDLTRQLVALSEKTQEIEGGKRVIKENSETHAIVVFSNTAISGSGIFHVDTTDRTTLYDGFRKALGKSQKFFIS